MLTHDWVLHPIFYGDNAAIAKMGKAQQNAMDKLEKGRTDITNVVAEFAIESELYSRVMQLFEASK
jgi:hypothetical protein